MTGVVELVGADTICEAIEHALRANLDQVVDVLGWRIQLGVVETFQQVPDMNAAAVAALPAVMIGAARVDFDTVRSGSLLDGAWQVAVGVRARGDDHADTAQRIKRWATAITIAVMVDPSLGGIASSCNAVSQHYDDLSDASQARTEAAAAVVFQIEIKEAIDVEAVRLALATGHLVETVHPSISISAP